PTIATISAKIISPIPRIFLNFTLLGYISPLNILPSFLFSCLTFKEDGNIRARFINRFDFRVL
ncbi:MAG TPA: hypothetical protein VJH20_00680, partial [Candidatus Nanoarchaeia archaeon]|nr:hypothetical protein [Candidatus Nanoarchaeia archaeon]